MLQEAGVPALAELDGFVEAIKGEFEEVEELQRKIAKKHGFKLVDHRMELFGVPLEDASDS